MGLPRVKLLNNIYKFRVGSPLKKYMNKVVAGEGWEKTYYTFGKILTTLKRVIAEENMVDIHNPSIILCSEELEKALDQKALHITEVWDLIMG